MKLKSNELEQHFISGLLKYPQKFHEISHFVTDSDFVFNGANRIVFQVLRAMISANEPVDPVLVAGRIDQLKITFSENIKPFDYVSSLSLRKISEEAFVQSAKELKKTSVVRDMHDKMEEAQRYLAQVDPSTQISDIVSNVDKLYNANLISASNLFDEPVNIFESMEEIVEFRGENPLEEVGFMGPYERVNSLYGSLLRPGDITVVVARSKAGKMMPLYQKILTPNGWKNHGTINIGDEVIDPKGGIAKVVGYFPHNQKEIYRITLDNGYAADCGLEHLWEVAVETHGSFRTYILSTEEILNIGFGPENPIYIPIFSSKNWALHSESHNHPFEYVKIAAIEKLDGLQDCACIALDSKSQLYITDDFIVTHNTTFALDYNTKVAAKYKTNVLHLDNGEMSLENLQMRQCAALSGVPMHHLEKGTWRKNVEYERRVRAVWPKIKGMKFDYYNVGGFSVEEMLNAIRRYYYGKVGRGNKMVLSFDYLKYRAVDASRGDAWFVVGQMLDSFKTLINREIVFNNEPQIAMFTSVQANRSGIARNGEVDDSENIVGLSDQVSQYCSHLFLLRKKTIEEVAAEGGKWGTHKLKGLLHRHLGEHVGRALNYVDIGNGTKVENYVSLFIDNFDIKEKGDVIDWLDSINVNDQQPIR